MALRFTSMLLFSISHECNREISVSVLTLIPALVIRLPQDKADLGVLSFALPVASFNQFKSHVFHRYSTTFRTNCDVTNFNTWKSICCKCSRSRYLLLAGNCCYWDFLSAAGVNRSCRFGKLDFYTFYNVLLFTKLVFVYFFKGTLNFKPRSVVCPAPSSLVLVTCSNVFFPSLILAL